MPHLTLNKLKNSRAFALTTLLLATVTTLTLAATLTQTNTTPQPSAAQSTVTLTVNPSQNINPFDPEMLGVQLPHWMHNHTWGKPYPDAVPGLGTAFNEAGIKLVRYGGGLEANDVGWERSIQKPRQDANYQALAWRPDRSKYSSQFSSQINTTNSYTIHYGRDEIDALGRFIQQTGINVMLQINIEEHDPAMWADLLHYANVEHNYNIKYFEIGNELDLVVWEQKSNVTPQLYRERLAAYLEALKKVDPDIQIISGVSAGGHNGYINGWKRDTQYSEYLFAGAQARSPSGYKSDALSYHWYSACSWFQTHTPQTIAQFANTDPGNFISLVATRQWTATSPAGIQSQILNPHLPNARMGITENNYDYCDFYTTPFNSNHLDTIRYIDTLGRLAYNGLDFNIWYTGFGDSYETYPMIFPQSLNPPITGYQLRASYYGAYLYGKYFGNQMVQSNSSNEANLSIWASTDSREAGAIKLMITNMTASPITAPINITGTNITLAQAYLLSNPNPTDSSAKGKSADHGTTINGTTLNYATIATTEITPQTLTNISGSTLTHTFPAYSATAINLNSSGLAPQPTPTAIPNNNCTYPSEILNLQSWKQTLPIGPTGNPTEIRQPQLATYTNDPYFQPTDDCTGVIFRAHTSGSTTSGSAYPRSELRQMATGGSSETSWSLNSGQNSMYLYQTITKYPNGKNHIVAGQIHDANDDVIAIRLEGNKLFIDHNGSPGPTLNVNYHLNTKFTAKFESMGDGKINVYYNDALVESYAPPNPNGAYYFKAGAYTQSNCQTETQSNQTCGADNYGEVIIYDLNLNNDTTPEPTVRAAAPPTTALTPTTAPQPTPNLPACTVTLNPSDSIGNAYSSASAGTVICLNPGTYTQSLNLDRSGAAGNHITIRSTNPAQRATINCKSCGLPVWGAIVTITGNYHTLQDLNVEWTNDFLSPNAIDAIRGFNVYDGTDLKLLNVNMTNIVDSCFLSQNYKNILIEGGEYYNCDMENSPPAKAANPQFYPDWGSAFSIAHGSENVTVRNIILHDSWGEGINFWSGTSYSLAENNIIYRLWAPYIYIDRGRYNTVRNNIIYATKLSDGITGRPIEVMNEDGHVTIRFPKMIGNKIYNNIFISAPGNSPELSCINIGDYDGASIEGDLLFANNTCVNLKSFGIGGALPGKINFINNLYYNSNPGTGAGNATFQNNLWNNSSGSGVPGSINNQDPQLTNPTATYEGAPDPNNYRINSESSPAVNAGTATLPTLTGDQHNFLTAIKTDFTTTTRTGNPDIGAFEYGSIYTGPNPSPPASSTPTPTQAPNPTQTPTPTPDPVNLQCDASCQELNYDLGFCSNYCNDISPRFQTNPNSGLCTESDRTTCCCQYNIGGAGPTVPPIEPTTTPTPVPNQLISFANTPRLCQLTTVIQNILNISLSLTGISAFIMFISGGYLWLTAGTNEKQITLAKQTLTWAIAGTVIMISAILILTIIEQFTGIPLTSLQIPWIGNPDSQPTICKNL